MRETLEKLAESLDEKLLEKYRFDTELFRRLSEIQRQSGILHDDRPICPFLRPHFFPRSRYERIANAAENLNLAFERLTEAAVVLQYIADRNPGTLAPQFGSIKRYHTMEWLNFIATELHKGLGPLWKPTTPEAYRSVVLDAVSRRFDYTVERLGDKPYLTGDNFTIVDAYLFTIVNWHNFLKFDISRWPKLAAYQARVASRPAVQHVLRAEHLIKDAKAA